MANFEETSWTEPAIPAFPDVWWVEHAIPPMDKVNDDQWDIDVKGPEPPPVKVDFGKLNVFCMETNKSLKTSFVVSALTYTHDLSA
jgi:hypothetical protein